MALIAALREAILPHSAQKNTRQVAGDRVPALREFRVGAVISLN